MVFGILRHIYKAIQDYYFPDKPVPESYPTPRLDISSLVPLYDTKGVIKGYVANVPPSSIPLQNNGKPKISAQLDSENVYYVRTTEGKYIPASIQQPLHASSLPLTTLAQNRTIGIIKKERGPSNVVEEWDGWPDGHFQRDFTFEEVEKTKHIMVHWASRTNGGDRKGDSHAESWELGKRSTRICLGVILCANQHCDIIIRPQTTSIRIAAQLRQFCSCGAHLIHQSCPIRSRLWTWSGGIHYENGGLHTHARPTHILHLSSSEETHRQAL